MIRNQNAKRASGILAHITSLPSPFGIGDIGPASYAFLDFLAAAGQSYWQFLPTGPTNPFFDNSPYMSTSAFAGSPLLISPDLLFAEGLISAGSLANHPEFNRFHTDYAAVADYKTRLLEEAYGNFAGFAGREFLGFARIGTLARRLRPVHGPQGTFRRPAAGSTGPPNSPRENRRRLLPYGRNTAGVSSITASNSSNFSGSGSCSARPPKRPASVSSATSRSMSASTASMSGPTSPSSPSTKGPCCRPMSPACRRIISAQPVSAGAIRSIAGKVGDAAVQERLLDWWTARVSAIFQHGRYGPDRPFPRLRVILVDTGGKRDGGRGRMASRPGKGLFRPASSSGWENSISSPKTWGSSPPRSAGSATTSAFPA